MDYTKINKGIWKTLDTSGNGTKGYTSLQVGPFKEGKPKLFLFIDEANNHHLCLEIDSIGKQQIEDPQVNGLNVAFNKYLLSGIGIKEFIDVSCTNKVFLEEYSEVVKEICEIVIEKNLNPLIGTNKVINKWKSFWGKTKKDLLSEEQQIGLICEILTLAEICEINILTAINSWVGPIGGKHDFNFSDWTLEVKGTRIYGPKHTINGIEQLKPQFGKKLGFVSFFVTSGIRENTFSLPDLIEKTIDKFFANDPANWLKFNDLLSKTGYNPIHKEEYRNFQIEIIEAKLFEVDDSFPKLIPDILLAPLSSRVSSVRYDVSLEGMKGINFNEISWGTLFY